MIESGQPVWALLTANEYLAQDAPLRGILVKKVIDAYESGVHDQGHTVFQHALSGGTLEEVAHITVVKRREEFRSKSLPFAGEKRSYSGTHSRPIRLRISNSRS